MSIPILQLAKHNCQILLLESSNIVLTYVHTPRRARNMETRIQFRIDQETKRLAQLMAESQGRTLSDACRDLTKQLAEEQRQLMSHDKWLTEQVNSAFQKLESGNSNFTDHDNAKIKMEAFKNKIRGRSS